MRNKKRVLLATLALTLAAAGTTLLISSQAEARGPGGGLLCGPTYMWSCSGTGGPDQLFIGTVCDKKIFERQTGLTCTPI